MIQITELKIHRLSIILSVANSNDPCGVNKPLLVSASTLGEITSPGFPLDYPDDQDCQWHLQVDEGFVVRITFLAFDLEAE